MCELPIHEHTLQCFSNPDADVETASVWERTFEKVDLTGNWNEDVLAIAKTQLGYTESTANYEVQEDGKTIKGYTRYGAWYGDAYGDWCTMFCFFCMNYADVDRDLIPYEAGCQNWIKKLISEEYDLYHSADTYLPAPGDLVFFDWDQDGSADHVGFVCEVTEATENETAKIRTIEGNKSDCVKYDSYDADDGSILGYGELPENPEMAEMAAPKMAPMMLMAVSGDVPDSSITWEITPASDGSYVLTFNGSGKIPDYFAAKAPSTYSDSQKAQINQELVAALEEIEASGNTVGIVIGPGITEIGTEAFYSRSMFTSVTFADNSACTKIGSSFYGCDKITTVDFGGNGALETIDAYAFYRMKGLKDVNLENCRNLKTIGAYAFAEYNVIENITIPASVVKLDHHAFYDCGSLKNVTFEPNENLNFIGYRCFSECDKMEAINLEALTNNCIKVGYRNEDSSGDYNTGYTFSHTYALKEVTIPSGFQMNMYTLFHFSHVGKITFQENNNTIPYASSVVSETYISELDLRPLKQLTSVKSFFHDNPNLHTVWIPASVTTISSTGGDLPMLRNIYFEEGSQLTRIEGSFHGNPSLEVVDLSELTNFITVGSSYYDCENLKKVALPESLLNFYTSVSDEPSGHSNVFYNDTQLEDVYFDAAACKHTIGELTFTNCGPFTLHIGKDVNSLPIELLQAASRSCGDVLFEGENNFTITEKADSSADTGLPAPLNDLNGEYYADESGALYKLNSDSTATLVYVPAYTHGSAEDDKWGETALTNYTIPATITDANGVTYTVNSVRPDAFLLAEKLTALTVDGTEYTAKDEAAAALSTKYSVTAELEYTSLNGASGPHHDDPDAPDSNYPEGGHAVRSAITEGKDQTTLTVSTSTNNSDAPVKPDQYELFTNENAEVVVSLSNKATVASKIARVYFAFDRSDYFFSNTSLNTPQTSTTDGKTFSYVLHRIEGTDTYYLDIGPVDEGSTGSLTFKPQFSSPNIDGGKLKVWGEVIDYVTDPATGEPVLDEDANPILPAPNTTIPDDKNCQIIEWITKPDPFAISKTADDAQKLIRRGNIKEETAEYDLTGLSYTLELIREGNDINKGKNYVDYVEFSDTLTLPEDIVWREGVIDAITNGRYTVTGGTTKTLTVTLDGTEYTVASVKATGMKNLTPEIVDGKLKLNWKTVNASETIEYSMGKATVVFGDEVLMLDPTRTYEEPKTIQIDNHVESDVYYNYETADQYKITEDGETVDPYKPYHTEDDASVTVTTGKGEIKLTKSRVQNDYWGSPSTWTITASNPTAFLYDNLGRVEDLIGRYITIHPDGMARMFAEDEYKELTITITKATLCLGSGITTYPTETVTTVDGSTAAQTSIQNSTVDAYEAYHGTETLKTWSGDVIAKNNQQAYTVVIKWKSDGSGLELSYSGPNSGTVDIGAPTEANIDAALESIHFLTDNETYYKCAWISEGERTTLDAHETRTYNIYANNKNTFEWITQDYVGEYYQSGRTYSSFTNYANAYTPEGTKLIAQSGGVTQSAKTRELVLDKSMSQNGAAFTEDTRLADNSAIENIVKLTHYGTGSYELLPVVDHMSGAQIAMAHVSENLQLANTGLETKEYNGEQYYLLTNPGTYRCVWLGGYCADSVTVTATDSGLDTIIKWYFKDTAPRAWTINIKYPTWVSYSDSGATGSSFEVQNEVWAGDHPTHRLYASMIGRGSTLDFNKFIVDTNDWNKDSKVLEEYMPIGTGEEVLYRLRLICTGIRTVTGDQIYDALPATFKAFAWSNANVDIVGYESTNGKITLSYTPDEGEPVSAAVGVGSANRTADIGGWTVSNVDPVTNKAVDGQYYILWDDDFEISYAGADYLDIFVRLSFPGTVDETDAWGAYCLAAGGSAVYNTFYLDGLPDSVHHDLKAPIKARLQKGVYDTGFFSMPMDYVYSWAQFPYVERKDTIYYSNDGADTSQRVNYYVNLYNEGPGRLYLDTVQDVLPEGFTYYSLTTVRFPYAYVYPCGADTSYKTSDYGRTEYMIYTSSSDQTRVVTTAKPNYKVGDSVIGYKISPLSKVLADNVDYVIADVQVDHSGTTADGRQIVKATFSNGSSVCTLLYDEQVGKYYLEANQCLRFGYSVNTNGYAKTKDAETNTVTMPVFDPYATGLTVSETAATADHNLPKNDGSCDLLVTPLLSEQGFDTAGYAQSTKWLVSDVTVLRDQVIPGIDKADTTIVRYNNDGTVFQEIASEGNLNYGDGVIWTLTSTNSSESTLHDYTITDTMPAPFEFKGPVYINVYDETHLMGNPSYGNTGRRDIPLVSSGNKDGITKVTSGGTVTSVIRPLFRLDRGENGSCTLVVRNGGTNVSIPLTSGQTVKVGGTGGDVAGLDIYRYRNYGNTRGELVQFNYTSRTYEVTWTKTDAGETLQIHFVHSIFDIPSRGSMTLEYETREMADNHVNQTYYNEAWLTPSQSFANVAQGRDTTLDGKHSVYDAEPINLVSGYSTVSYKTVTEVDDSTNTASSSDEKNYIDLPGTDSLFDYGLNITGPSEEMETFVLIDNLPEVGDHAVFVDSVPRNSPFKVSLAEDPNFRLYVQTATDEDYVLFTGTYNIEYSAKNASFDRRDWQGEQNWYDEGRTSPVWQNEPDNTTRSIRLTMSDVPANAKIRLVYTAQIEGEAEPGTIAWNNFGYSYRVNVAGAPWLNATPPNVGIRVPSIPTLQKKLELEGEPIPAIEDATFTFCIYKGDPISGLEGAGETDAIAALTVAGLTANDYRIYTRSIAKGASESAVLTLKENDFWLDGESYHLVELDPGEMYEFDSINQRTLDTFTFTYQQEDNNLVLTAVNRRSAWEILLTKTDARNGSVVLKDAVFGLYSPSIDDRLMLAPATEGGDATVYSGADATIEYDGKTYYLTGKSTTAANGQIRWAQLYQNEYVVVELEAPPAYRIMEEPILVRRGEDDTILLTVENDTDYELPDSGGVGTIPIYALGALLMAGAIMCDCKLRRRCERRAE